ncbi:helix-turn-helix domain-containing protein [Asanoa sp. WMMD1127]|uniref:helix-turn-helix domain-containing protein n=1 Tax=Asanoa sp. WMMD1127 TaxID=3016107 RepID=UPI0024177B62|nr:helix-turn-helix domain-containing protein [Asanoa sp. WMMD1127]MDG4823270.1 helix-turn-helix domain-containing protein [Asanoa sp. WMMD1127]
MNENTARTLLHPVRLRIVSEFTGGQRTVRELAEALPDVPQATLYRHVAALLEGGVLQQVGERAARGPSERIYRVAQGADRIPAEEVDSLSAAEHRRVFSVFAASLVDSFAAYVDSGKAVPSADGLSYNRAVVNLSTKEMDAFGKRFGALVAEVLAIPPARHRRRYHLASCVIPAVS